MTLRWLIALLALPVLAACSGEERDISLRTFHSLDDGPEEFAILPTGELQKPESYAALPPPTPGGANRTDPTPRQDAVAALGGQPGALVPAGIPAADGALVAYVGRNGTAPGIRRTLAQEDEDFRRRKSRFGRIRIVRTDRYYNAYKRQALDAQAVKRRWRNAGAPTPTAPPEN